MTKNTKPMGSEESGDEYEVSESKSEPEQSFKTTQKKVQPPQAESEPEPDQAATTTQKKVSDEEASDSESESEPEPDQAPTTTQKKVSDEEASSSEEDSESAPTTTQKKVSSSESDQPAPTTQKKIQPQASLSEPDQTALTTQEKKVSSSEEESSSSDELQVEKTVTKNSSEAKAVEKKLLFQRFWSESDEIAILNGMIDYPNKTKLDPVANMGAFHDFIKDKFHQEVTRTQLRDKIWKLRKKYEKNTSKTKDMGGRKAHDQKIYELSKLVWGKDEGVGSVRKASCKRSACDITLDVGENRVEKMMMKIGSDLFEMGSGIEGEREWKRLKVEEFELSIKQMEVKVAQSKLVLGVFKSNNI